MSSERLGKRWFTARISILYDNRNVMYDNRNVYMYVCPSMPNQLALTTLNVIRNTNLPWTLQLRSKTQTAVISADNMAEWTANDLRAKFKRLTASRTFTTIRTLCDMLESLWGLRRFTHTGVILFPDSSYQWSLGHLRVDLSGRGTRMITFILTLKVNTWASLLFVYQVEFEVSLHPVLQFRKNRPS